MGLLPFLLEMAAGAEEEGKLFKVIVCGEYACGKTSIISRYTSNTFSPNYKLTIGVDFTLKVLEHKGEAVKLQLWDIGINDAFARLTDEILEVSAKNVPQTPTGIVSLVGAETPASQRPGAANGARPGADQSDAPA